MTSQFSIARHCDERWNSYFVVETFECADGYRTRICGAHFNNHKDASDYVERYKLRIAAIERSAALLRKPPPVIGDPVPPWGLCELQPTPPAWPSREDALRRAHPALQRPFPRENYVDIKRVMHYGGISAHCGSPAQVMDCTTIVEEVNCPLCRELLPGKGK